MPNQSGPEPLETPPGIIGTTAEQGGFSLPEFPAFTSAPYQKRGIII
jgi:hypothetical protein